MIDVIIPARNEAGTVGDIVRVFRQHSSIGKVVVVVDADTTDDTDDRAMGNGAIVVNGMWREVRGKGQCIKAGLEYVSTDQVILWDADVARMTYDHISTLVYPRKEFVIGVPDYPLAEVLMTPAIQNAPEWFSRTIATWDIVSGERLVSANLLRGLDLHGYLCEVQINHAYSLHSTIPEFRFLRGLYSPFVLSEKRLEEMQRDRLWGISHGIIKEGN